ncbi:tryptophan synthase subunit alpha [Allosaccharopolyspora coralli]|uniref:Tryptophan synthase alpha chain n=1 Tax=Allosaccharopolyspora coralli TaxID=2665642 RepID=A0A5Q3Q8E3_9PSEU|nr:tryptophan synthase subunit alpha [Allosaccharopolyspora coralli]QGK70828.1 tryptophan synthase subunit alpha [Allosaccharopolyspora coralli]
MSLNEVFTTCRAENRAALIGYLPAGFPSVEESKDLLGAMIAGTAERPGCDLVEVGLPFSDPVIDGPTIQAASDDARKAGFRVRDLFDVVSTVAAAGGSAVVMSYWNPIHHYGPDAFARDLAAAGGLGLITPDLVPDEAEEWLSASQQHGLDRIFLVAPASTEERIAMTVKAGSGFVYATSVMGVTGARDSVGSQAAGLVRRTKAYTDLPVGVGLGVRNGEQAAEVASFADGVIVGSEFVTRARAEGTAGVGALAAELADGVRRR